MPGWTGSHKESNNSWCFLEAKNVIQFNFSAVLIFEMRSGENKRSRLHLPERQGSAGAWLTMGMKRTGNHVTHQNKLEVSAFWNTILRIGRVVYVHTAA